MAKSKPTHIAKIAREYEGTDGKKKSAWTDIGVAWPVKGGEGLRVILDAYPVGGEMFLLPNTSKAKPTADEE